MDLRTPPSLAITLILLGLAFSPEQAVAQSDAVVPRRSDVKEMGAEVTIESRKAIERGTKYLVTRIYRNGVSAEADQPADLSCTAIVGLALLSQGNTLSGGPQSRELRQLLDAVLNRVEELPPDYEPKTSFMLVQRKIGRNAPLFLSALFLSQMLGDSGNHNVEIRESLDKLVQIIARTQGKDGTWGDESWAPVLGTVLGWESLRAASSCGLKINASAELAGTALYNKLRTTVIQEHDWMQRLYKDASSVRVLHSMGYRQEPVFEECVQRIITTARDDDRVFMYAGGEEYLAFFLTTECLLQEPRESWRQWYPTVRDKLVRYQNRDGSWSGHHCITSRTFCTAAALLTLQAPNRVLPISDL